MAAAAGGRKARDRLSILDISVEDDALIPLPGLDEEPQESEEPSAQMPEIPSSKECAPEAADFIPRPARKKTSRSSLRKSLAWDKAFLTGEGVLDADELPIVTRPKTLPEMPVFDVNTRSNYGTTTPATKEDPPRSETTRSSMDMKLPTIQETREITSGNSRSRSERFHTARWSETSGLGLHKSASQRPQQHMTAASLSFIPRPAPAKKAIESAIQKGTRLKLPSPLPRSESAVLLPLKEKPTSSLTKKVSSVSKRVKDTLGRVLPGGRPGKISSPGDPASPMSPSEGSASDSLEDKPRYKGREPQLLRSSTMSRVPENTSSTKLKMPSPKLGFFDPAAQQSAKMSVIAGHAVRVPTAAPKGKPHGIPRGRPAFDLAAPRPSEKELASAPSTPRTTSNDLLSPGTRSAVSNSTITPKGKHGGIPGARAGSKSSRKLGLDELASSKVEKAPEPSTENHSENKPKEGSSKPAVEVSRIPAAPAEIVRNPLAVMYSDSEVDHHQHKEKSSFFAMAKKAVQRLSPLHDNKTSGGGGQENQAPPPLLPPPPPIPRVKSTVVEIPPPSELQADTKDGAIVKTGPVQHSPPIKPATEPNPWSPVKKNPGQELGPFDCTKLNARAASVDWEVL